MAFTYTPEDLYKELELEKKLEREKEVENIKKNIKGNFIYITEEVDLSKWLKNQKRRKQ